MGACGAKRAGTNCLHSCKDLIGTPQGGFADRAAVDGGPCVRQRGRQLIEFRGDPQFRILDRTFLLSGAGALDRGDPQPGPLLVQADLEALIVARVGGGMGDQRLRIGTRRLVIDRRQARIIRRGPCECGRIENSPQPGPAADSRWPRRRCPVRPGKSPSAPAVFAGSTRPGSTNPQEGPPRYRNRF